MSTTHPIITFWQVTDVKKKLEIICQLVQHHFNQAERVLISVPNEAAARYVDQLLWTMPPESFLPHTVAETPVTAAIVISTSQSNLNHAQVLINLCPQVSPVTQEFLIIHELFDETDQGKQKLSHERQAAYLAMGIKVKTEQLQTSEKDSPPALTP